MSQTRRRRISTSKKFTSSLVTTSSDIFATILQLLTSYDWYSLYNTTPLLRTWVVRYLSSSRCYDVVCERVPAVPFSPSYMAGLPIANDHVALHQRPKTSYSAHRPILALIDKHCRALRTFRLTEPVSLRANRPHDRKNIEPIVVELLRKHSTTIRHVALDVNLAKHMACPQLMSLQVCTNIHSPIFFSFLFFFNFFFFFMGTFTGCTFTTMCASHVIGGFGVYIQKMSTVG